MTDDYRRYYFANERAAKAAREYESALQALKEISYPPGADGVYDPSIVSAGQLAGILEDKLTVLEAAAPGCGVELWPVVKL